MKAELNELVTHTGTVWDAVWHHAVRVDPAAQEKGRRRQILELARYGRLGGGLHDWDDEPVAELRAWWEVLREMMEGESAVSRALDEAT